MSHHTDKKVIAWLLVLTIVYILLCSEHFRTKNSTNKEFVKCYQEILDINKTIGKVLEEVTWNRKAILKL